MSSSADLPLSEYQSLRKILQENLDILDHEMTKQNIPEFQVTQAQLHPADAPDFVPSDTMFKARRNAVAAMDMLTAAMQDSAEKVSEHFWSHWLEVAIQVATRTNIIEHLIAAGVNGVHVHQLSINVGMDASKLAKILRLLAVHFYLVEVDEDRFAIARRGLLLAPGSPLRSLGAWQSWFSFTHSLKCMETWSDPNKASSWKPLDTPAAAAFNWKGLGCEDLWQWAARDHPEEIAQFASAMHAIPAASVVTGYDWSALPEDALIVDVGGGSGHVALSILKAFPHLRAIVQDRPEIRQHAEDAFKTHLPTKGDQTDDRITYQGIDFFEYQPQRHADVYILRFILHDLDDDRAAVVLGHVKDAMGPHSKILVVDFELSPAIVAGSQGSNSLNEVRELAFPLLHSTLAPKYVLTADLEMSAAIAGTERTKAQSIKLFQRVGLQISNHIYTRGPFSMYEITLP